MLGKGGISVSQTSIFLSNLRYCTKFEDYEVSL